MSNLTPNLNLFKYDVSTDTNVPFSITTALNNNWDIIDAKCTGGGLEVCDIGMALYVDETKGLRRYLNGQIVDINANTQAFLNRLKEITTLHPSLLCTEDEWQTAKTLSAFGQVGKFVFNYSGDNIVSVRIPRVVNVQGLFDLQNLGMTVSAGLPNITGQIEIDDSAYEDSSASGAFTLSQGSGMATGWDKDEHKPIFNFDASRSSSIYGNSTTVQPEAIQYPYFIQIATGSETENNIINDIELNNPYSLFDFKWSDHELNNLSWTRGDTFDWKPSTTYPSAYNELLSEYNNAESVEETEDDITFKRTPKGYKIALVDQESAILKKYNTDGIAWYYILDTTNKKFKLPRTKFGFEGIRNSVGDDIDESLPNITGDYQEKQDKILGNAQNTVYNGCFYGISIGNQNTFGTSSNTYNCTNLAFDASRSSSTYQDNAPVQERATQMYLYFYVGETVQNANLIDAGRIGEVINNLTECIAVVETYQNGSSWYRVYSDGWCEQGGISPSGADQSTQTVTLLKAFGNANYNVVAIQRDGPSGNYTNGLRIVNYTTASFQINYRTGGNTTAYWQACGYIA